MIRKIVGILFGIVGAFAVAMAMEKIGHSIWPPAKGVNFNDPAQVAAMMNAMPAMAFQWLLLGWSLALVAGTFIAKWIAKSAAAWTWITVATLFLAATAANLLLIRHPQWFNVEAVVVLLAVFAALTIYHRKSSKAN